MPTLARTYIEKQPAAVSTHLLLHVRTYRTYLVFVCPLVCTNAPTLPTGWSSCGPNVEMALREHLRQAERKGLGENTARIGNTGAQNMRFHACSFFRSFPAPHTPSPQCRVTWWQLVISQELHSHIRTSRRWPTKTPFTNLCSVAGVVTQSSKVFFFCRHDKNLRIYRRHFCPLAYTHK